MKITSLFSQREAKRTRLTIILGGLQQIYSQSALYISTLNFIMMFGIFYGVVIIKTPWLQWITLPLFIIGVAGIGIIGAFIIWKIVIPHLSAYGNYQAYRHDNPIARDLYEIKRELSALSNNSMNPKTNTKTIVIAGGFDPIHRGHLDHIMKAKALGNWLIAITHPDNVLIQKKGYCLLPLADRIEILADNKWVNEVVVSIDTDGTVAKTLEMLRQNTEGELIFAKGGDRTPDNMPQNEIDTCKRLKIKLFYGIGDKINSSQDLVEKAIKTDRRGIR